MPNIPWRRYQAFLKAHPYRETNGIAYLEAGQGDPPLVFLHGLLETADAWWQQFEDFSHALRVVAPTLPAFDTLVDLAERVLGFLDALGLDRVVLVGNSLGGYLAQYLAARAPERLRAAVFSNTAPPLLAFRLRVALRVARYRRMPEERLKASLRRFVEKRVYLFEGASPLPRDYLLQAVERISKATFVQRYQALTTPFRVPRLEIPHMVIYSTEDQLIPRGIAREMLRVYPEAEHHHMIGHFSYLSDPRKYDEHLGRFLNRYILFPFPSPPSST